MTPAQHSALESCAGEFRAVLDELVEDRGRYSDAFLLGMVHAQKGGGLAAQRKAAEAVLDLMQQQDGFGSLSGCMRGLAERHSGRDAGGQPTFLQPVDDVGLLRQE